MVARSVFGICLSAALLCGCSCGEQTATFAAEIEVSPASLDFGTAAPGATVSRSVTISNLGSEPLTLSELVLAGPAASAFSVAAPSALQIPGGDSVTASLSYAPKAQGSHSATLLIRSDAVNTQEVAVSLSGSAQPADPCAKIQCNLPPGPCYQATGTCSNGACSYLPKADNTPCNDGNSCTDADVCRAGLCRGTPKTCTTPPAGTCKDATSFTSYASPGSCVGGICQYASAVRACSGGCTNNVCSGNPCAGVTCNSPPVCFWAGSCSGGACQYMPNPGATCDDGDPCTIGDACSFSGACVGTPKSCQTPPPPSCVNAQTQRSYDPVGSCGAGGVCSYVSHDTTCALGCNAVTGQCTTSCAPGSHLCSGTCVSDSSTSSCGASCTPCPSAANATATCANGTCGLQCNAGYVLCGGVCVMEGPQTCGPSCMVCPSYPHGTAACVSGGCSVTCNVGYPSCDQWSTSASSTTTYLRAVWGSGPSDVWTAGDSGVIIRWSGSAWAISPNSTNGNRVQGVWGSGPNDVWAVQDLGYIDHWNGTAWSNSYLWQWKSNLLPTHLTGVWGSGPSDVWAVGYSEVSASTWQGGILHWNGSAWSVTPDGTNVSSVRGIWGSGPNDVWAVGGSPGNSGNVLHWNGTGWTTSSYWNPAIPGKMWSIHGSGASDVWAVGHTGISSYAGSSFILHRDLGSWSPVPAGNGPYLLGVWASGPADAWAVGGAGTILHWNGSAWSSVLSPTTQDLEAVWGSGPGDVWAVGAAGTILHLGP